MANIFLTESHDDIETAIMLENAKQCDLSKISPSLAKAVAFTDGKRVFVNSDDNLATILPSYSKEMLKWLLWHERYHIELRHHKRFFKYSKELSAETTNVSQAEVNIIMDILVHDSLCKLFPELVETAKTNLAQMRNRNSLNYTFKTTTLEEMLDEYSKYKADMEDKESERKPAGDPSSTKPSDEEDEEPPKTTKAIDRKSDKKDGKKETPAKKKPSHDKKEEDEKPKEESETPASKDEQEPADWDALKDRDSTEFIDEELADDLENKINKVKQRKFKLGRLAQTLNGLSTSAKARTYAVPSYMNVSPGVILKGRRPGKTPLYLCFDASGSMSDELSMFKKVISESIPQAKSVPCEWFAGSTPSIARNPKGRNYDYYKGTFDNMKEVYASGGYHDDGDRTIELCLQAEEQGYSPIGVTDGGGCIDHPEILIKLKRTILIGTNEYWLKKANEINPHIQVLSL